MPRVSLKVQLSKEYLAKVLGNLSETFSRMAQKAIDSNRNLIEVITYFEDMDSGIERHFDLSPVLIPSLSPELRESMSEQDLEARKILESDFDKFIDYVVDDLPFFSLFQEEDASLPDTIVLTGLPTFKGQKGARGASNFVRAAGIDVKMLSVENDRLRGSRIRAANVAINRELGKYWSQQFGNNQKINLEVEFSRYPPDHPTNAGAAYLSFWVSEGAERFYPSQRSRGTRWFISVFLHLLATEKERGDYVILLDEPGSFLHARAQEDVRLLIERISAKCPVVYSTHIPALVDFTKPYRVLAVERVGESELADTQIYQALKIAAASRETLSPILEKMGADMRHQAVIKQSGNVILEEPSAHFYLRAFEKMLFDGELLSYIPASGVNNVPVMFSLMLAWGLRFAVLLDDDRQGREVRKELFRNYFGDNSEAGEAVVHRVRDCEGVEDLFGPDDFFGIVLQARHGAPDERKNSQAAKGLRIQKPVVAYQFYVRVERGEIRKSDFSEQTIRNFSGVIERLRSISL